MSLTLAQAKASLARVADNGVCATDPRLPDRINEVVARLHAMGDFIGSVARYGIDVDANGEFPIPDGLQNVMRVSELPNPTITGPLPGLSPTLLPHSATGSLLTDSEHAFLFDSASILPLVHVTPTRYRIAGIAPSSVDVMGKKKLVPAVADNDELSIDDTYALKLGLLALWREENDMLDAAKALWAEAVGHLATKTETAVSEARRSVYTALVSGCPLGTMGYTRAKVALAVNDGVKMADHKIFEVINSAEKRLLQKMRLHKAVTFAVNSGVLALPYEMECILRIDMENRPLVLRPDWYEYSQDGYGYHEDGPMGPSCIFRGESPLHAPLEDGGIITIASLSPGGLAQPEIMTRVVITGTINGDRGQTVVITFHNGAASGSISGVTHIDSISKDISKYGVQVMSGATEVARIPAHQMESKTTLYAVPFCEASANSNTARVLARPRFVEKVRDTDPMQIENVDAITNMVFAILAERAKELDLAVAYEARATMILDEELKGKQQGPARRIEVQRRGFSAGTVSSLR